jgi:hypothetical protein
VAGLTEDLELNIQPALSSVADLAAELTKAALDFSTTLSEALSTAVQGVDNSLTLSPDVSAITAEGDSAVQAIDPTVVLQADTTDLVAQGDAAMQSVFESQVSNVATGTGNAQGIIASGAEAATAAEGVTALEGATRGAEAATAGLEGNLEGVTGLLGPFGAATAAAGGAMGIFFHEAVNEETALNRLNFVYGQSVASVQQVTLANNNFSQSLQQIATSTGASLPGLEQANSKIGSIGFSAGATAPAITQTANQITALATYLAVTNPALGSADTIMNSLTGSLARGGRSAASLGLSLSATEIAAKAHSIATADGRDTVSQFDKIAAGAAITTDKLGTSLGDAVAKGSDSAALALPKLTESLKETIATVGTPLIGPITKLFADLGPVLGSLATTIGHLLEAFTPLLGVLGLVGKALQYLADVINAIPMPILTTAVLAFTASLVVEKVSTFAAGLFTLGANATADVGAVGLLTGAVDGLVASLGPLGLAVATIGAVVVVSNAAASSNADNANKLALATAGLKSNADVAKESVSQLQAQLDAVNTKIAELKAQNPSGSSLVPTLNTVDGQKQIGDYASGMKALTGEAATLKTSLDAAKTSTGALSSSQSAAAATSKAFGDAMTAAAVKLDGAKVAMASVESANNSLVTTATGKLAGVSTTFGDVSAAIDAAAKAADKQATSSGSASNALAQQATHAKDLRDATLALEKAQEDFNTLAAGPTADQIATGLLNIESAAKTTRDALQKVNDAQAALATLAAGPTAEELAAGYLTIEQAARSTRSAQQAVIDAQMALKTLAGGPTGDARAQAAEDVAKAQLNQQKATTTLSDAQIQLTALINAGTASDRQLADAKIKIQEAEFGVTDAGKALNVTMVAQAKLISDALPNSQAMKDAHNKLADAQLALQAAQQSQEATQDKQNQLIADSVPGSKALETAHNNLSDAELALVQAQRAQQVAQDAQTKLFANALPTSDAYIAAVQKVSDAQDHLTTVVESGNAKQGASATAAAKTHVDALASLQKGLDDQIAAEDKFFTDLEKIQAEGGTAIVAELLAQGPKTGAAEASAIAGATVTVVGALETKTETLKTKEDQHAQEIATIFGASLNANLVKAFSTQLANETNFYANVRKIFDAGNADLATNLRDQGPVQGGALAGAVANATPQVQHALEVQAEQLKAFEGKAGAEVGSTFGDGLFAGINGANARVFAAAQALGTSAQAGTAAAIKPGSPSRVAMELGSQWAEGLALGITGGIPLVASAASQLASALVVSPNAPALSTGSTVTSTAQAASAPGAVVQHVTVNEVAQDPQATAFAVASRLGQQATR